MTLTEIKCVFLSAGPETPGYCCLGATPGATEHTRDKRRESKIISNYVKKSSFVVNFFKVTQNIINTGCTHSSDCSFTIWKVIKACFLLARCETITKIQFPLESAGIQELGLLKQI